MSRTYSAYFKPPPQGYLHPKIWWLDLYREPSGREIVHRDPPVTLVGDHTAVNR